MYTESITAIVEAVSTGVLDIYEGTNDILGIITESDMMDKNEFKKIMKDYKDKIATAKALIKSGNSKKAKAVVIQAKQHLEELKVQVKSMSISTSKATIMFIGNVLKTGIIVGGIASLYNLKLQKDYKKKAKEIEHETSDMTKKVLDDTFEQLKHEDIIAHAFNGKDTMIHVERNKKIKEIQQSQRDKLYKMQPKYIQGAGTIATVGTAAYKTASGIKQNGGISKEVLNTVKTNYLRIINMEIAKCNRLLKKIG